MNYQIINGESSAVLKTFPDNHFDSIVTDPVLTVYYVYLYLREGGTPYYVGKGKGYRAYSKQHIIPKPTDKSRIIKVAENLDEKSALALEIELIKKYGRKDLGTGCLRNTTNGGDGVSGYKYTEEQNKANSQRQKGKKRGPSSLKGKPSGKKGRPQPPYTEEQKENHRIAMEKRRGKNPYERTEESLNKMRETKRNNPQTPWNKGLVGQGVGRKMTSDCIQKRIETRKRNKEAKSTGMAAVKAGYEYVGIDLDPKYCEISRKRIDAWCKDDTEDDTNFNQLFTIQGDNYSE